MFSKKKNVDLTKALEDERGKVLSDEVKETKKVKVSDNKAVRIRFNDKVRIPDAYGRTREHRPTSDINLDAKSPKNLEILIKKDYVEIISTAKKEKIIVCRVPYSNVVYWVPANDPDRS